MDISPADPTTHGGQRSYPRLKVLYLLAVTVAAFLVPTPFNYVAVPVLMLLQVALLLAYGISPWSVVKCLTRVKYLFVFLVAFYAFWPWSTGNWVKVVAGLSVNATGLVEALVMCGRIATAILASTWVRVSGPGTELIEGLRRFGLPKLFRYSIDNTLALIGGLDPRPVGGGGRRGGTGGGSGRRRRERASEADEKEVPREQVGFLAIVRRLVRGDIGFFIRAIEANLDASGERLAASGDDALQDPRFLHDVKIVSGIGLMMMTMKLLKIAPGFAFAAGHKTLLLIPLYILATHLTYSRFGGTTAGSVMGVIAFLNGDSRYGIFEILKHLVPGFVVDLIWPVVRPLRGRRIQVIVYCLLGLVVGVARTATQFGIALAINLKWEALTLFAANRLVPNVMAGTLSGFVTYFLLQAFRHLEPARQQEGEPETETIRAEAESQAAPASLGE
jgi:hypothetical protein